MVWEPRTRCDYARDRRGYTSDMTEREWSLIASLVQAGKRLGRPRKYCFRDLVNAIFYRLQSGCQWDMLPRSFPPWQTVYRYFRAWQEDGIWAGIHDALYCQTRVLEGREESPSFAIVDSHSAKTGPDAHEIVGFDAGKKIKGRKRHIVVDTLGLILKAEAHSAGIQDRDGLAPACKGLTTRSPFVETICADGGYQGPIAQGNAPTPLEIIKRNEAGFQVLPKRWIVERTFAWLGINRRLAKDFERYAKTSLAFIQAAMIKLMTRRLARYIEF